MRKDVLFTIFHLKLQNGHSLAPNRAERTISWLMGGSICWMEGYLMAQFCAESLRADKFKLSSGAPPIWIWQIHPDQFRRPHLFQMFIQADLHFAPTFLLMIFPLAITAWLICQFSIQLPEKHKRWRWWWWEGGDEHWHRSHEGQIWSRVSCRLP